MGSDRAAIGFAGGTFNRIKYCKSLIINYLSANGIEPAFSLFLSFVETATDCVQSVKWK